MVRMHRLGRGWRVRRIHRLVEPAVQPRLLALGVGIEALGDGFVGARIGNTSLEKAAAGALIFIGSMLIILMLITYVPPLSLAPLSLMGK